MPFKKGDRVVPIGPSYMGIQISTWLADPRYTSAEFYRQNGYCIILGTVYARDPLTGDIVYKIGDPKAKGFLSFPERSLVLYNMEQEKTDV